jgi:organic radical activating enzyme
MSEENEIPLDIKNDIQLAFNLYKNEKNKINKLKLRTILFSFVMYKYSASEINEFIESRTLKEKEFYSFDDVCDLVKEKLLESKERESDELFNYIVNNKKDKTEINKMNKAQLMNAFKENEINIEENELDKMFEYIQRKDNEEEEENAENEEKKSNEKKDVGRNGFKKFYIERK